MNICEERFVGLGTPLVRALLEGLAGKACRVSVAGLPGEAAGKVSAVDGVRIGISGPFGAPPVPGAQVTVAVPGRGVAFESRLLPGSTADLWALGYPSCLTVRQRRKVPRRRVDIPARFMCEGTNVWDSGTIAFISRAGLVVVTAEVITPGTALLTRFSVPGSPIPLLARANALWSRRYKGQWMFGAEFSDLAWQVEAHIVRGFDLPGPAKAWKGGTAND